MIDSGYIKLYRQMLQWEWYTDANTFRVFLHCLFKANWKDGRYRGQIIKRGSFVTGRKALAKELKMSEQEIRTALEHLKATNEITIKATNRYSVITVVNYGVYQDLPNTEQPTKQPTKHQTNNQQLTTIEESKNIRKEEYTLTDAREESEPMKHPYGIYNNVYLTDQEMDELIKAYPGEYQDMIENLSAYMRSKGKVYGDHYATMMKWKREDAEKKRQQADTYDYRKDVI